jgi:hypothetical protein
VVEGQLEDEFGRRGHAQVTAGRRRLDVEMFLETLQNLVRVQRQVTHHLREGVPLDLGECEENVLVGQQRVITAAGFFDRAIDDPLR